MIGDDRSVPNPSDSATADPSAEPTSAPTADPSATVDPSVDPSPSPTDEEWPTITIWDSEGNPLVITLLPAYKEETPYWVETEDYKTWYSQIPFEVMDLDREGTQQCIVKYELDGVRKSIIHWLPTEILNNTYTNYTLMNYYGYDAVFRVDDCLSYDVINY